MDANTLAKYVIAYSEQIGKPVNNIRLQALLYYLQHLFYNDIKYTKDGIFYVPDVYYEYCCQIGYLLINKQIEEKVPAEVKEVVNRHKNIPTWRIIARIIDEHMVDS